MKVRKLRARGDSHNPWITFKFTFEYKSQIEEIAKIIYDRFKADHMEVIENVTQNVISEKINFVVEGYIEDLIRSNTFILDYNMVGTNEIQVSVKHL